MKKGLLVLLLLLPVVFAQGVEQSVQSEFASLAESQQMAVYDMKESLAAFERAQVAKLEILEKEVETINKKVDLLVKPGLEKPSSIGSYNYLLVLLFVNVALLVVAIVMIVYLRKRYSAHLEQLKFEEEHVHPVPDDLVVYVKAATMLGKSLHDVRIDLAGKGWTPSMIEHAIRAARTKK